MIILRNVYVLVLAIASLRWFSWEICLDTSISSSIEIKKIIIILEKSGELLLEILVSPPLMGCIQGGRRYLHNPFLVDMALRLITFISQVRHVLRFWQWPFSPSGYDSAGVVFVEGGDLILIGNDIHLGFGGWLLDDEIKVLLKVGMVIVHQLSP